MKKRSLVALVTGAGYGFISFCWLVLAALFLFPGSSPGSLDWEHDVFLIPVGLILLACYLAVTGLLIVKGRKDKRSALLFLIAALVICGAMLFSRLV